jgi:hypothetical protein
VGADSKDIASWVKIYKSVCFVGRMFLDVPFILAAGGAAHWWVQIVKILLLGERFTNLFVSLAECFWTFRSFSQLVEQRVGAGADSKDIASWGNIYKSVCFGGRMFLDVPFILAAVLKPC